MATLHQNPQATDANQEQDLDELQVPEPHRQNPLWKIIKSTAKRTHESWEVALADGMQKHQNAISGVVKGAHTFVNQSIHTATNAYDSVAKGVTTEARAGIKVVRQSLGLKAASDELDRELKLSESALGGSPALPHEQRVALNKLVRAEQSTIQYPLDRTSFEVPRHHPCGHGQRKS